jgi:hypothetical protein
MDDKKNDVSLQRLNDNKIFGVGIDFSDSLNLMNSNFALNLMTGVQSNDPYHIWLYFHSLANL